MNNEYADGFYFKGPREGARDFVKGSMSIKLDKAIAYLNEQNKLGEEWLNFDLLTQKADANKWSAKKDTWKKDKEAQEVTEGKPANPYADDNADPKDVPFASTSVKNEDDADPETAGWPDDKGADVPF